jgi:hypothetical protein
MTESDTKKTFAIPAIKVLEQGSLPVIYPEGRISNDGTADDHADWSLSEQTDALARSFIATQKLLAQLPQAESIDQQDLILETDKRLRELTSSLILFLESNKSQLAAGEQVKFYVAEYQDLEYNKAIAEAVSLLEKHLEELGYSVVCMAFLGPWHFYIRKAVLPTELKKARVSIWQRLLKKLGFR